MKIGEAYITLRAKMGQFTSQLRTAQDKTKMATSRMQSRFTSLRGGVDKLSKSVFSLRGGIVALAGTYGIGKLVGSFISVASESENCKMRLDTLLGSAEEGSALFRDLNEFAAQVPYTLTDVRESATMLAGVMKGGRDEIMQWMPAIADVAAASGLGIQEASGQILRMVSAGIGACDLFRERGVKSMLGFKDGVKYTTDESKAMFMAAWNDIESQFRGATDKLKTGWSGMMSNFNDAWTQFRQAVMDADVFQALKTSSSELLKEIGRLKTEGKLDEWARIVAEKALRSFELLISGIGFVGKSILSLQAAWRLVKDAFVDMTTIIFEDLSKLGDKLSIFADIGAILGMPSYAKLSEKLQGLSGDADQLAKDFAFMGDETEDAIDRSSASIEKWEKGIKTILKKITGLKTETEDTADTIKKKLTPATEGSKKAFSGISETVKRAVIPGFDEFMRKVEELKLKQQSLATISNQCWGDMAEDIKQWASVSLSNAKPFFDEIDTEFRVECPDAVESAFGSGGSIFNITNGFFNQHMPACISNLGSEFSRAFTSGGSVYDAFSNAFAPGGAIFGVVAAFFSYVANTFFSMLSEPWPSTGMKQIPGVAKEKLYAWEQPGGKPGWPHRPTYGVEPVPRKVRPPEVTPIVLNPQPLTIAINLTNEVAGKRVQQELFSIITEAAADGKITISPTAVRKKG